MDTILGGQGNDGINGGDDNDLPTKKMAANIKKHVEELL